MWFLLAVFSGFFESSASAAAKHAANIRQYDTLTIVFSKFFYSIPFLIVTFILFGKLAADITFWAVVIGILLPTEVTAQLLFQRAITLSPLSLTMPLISFTPIVTLLFSLFTLKEIPSTAGTIGVLFVVFGSYFLNFDKINLGIIKPFQALFEQSGARIMMVVAILWGITTPFQKIAINHSDPVFFALVHITTLALALLILLLLRNPQAVKLFPKSYSLAPIGFLSGLGFLSQYFALPLGPVAYYLGVKRTGILWTAVYDRLFFGDRESLKRIPAIILMFLGVLLIQFGG